MGRGQASGQSCDVQASEQAQSLHDTASKKRFADRNGATNIEMRRVEALSSSEE
jgi:hypothetical protein